MNFESANAVLADIPYTGTRKGRWFYDFVTQHRPQNVLELGFAYGASTLYLAAALDEIGSGHIDTVDLIDGHHGYRLEELSSELKLQHLLSIHREASSYTWYLKKKIEERTTDGVCEPLYDLCFIDGPKDWTNDGAAFFMVDKLLKPGGWIIFDDYGWSYRQQEATSGSKYERGYVFETMSEEEWSQPQIEAVFRLLVAQHPHYGNLSVVDNTLAVAQKVQGGSRGAGVKFETSMTAGYAAFAVGQRALRLIRRLSKAGSSSRGAPGSPPRR